MDFIVLPMVALGASLLTFFSGFGLGTLLTPVFALYFPVEVAVGLTAVVHFLSGVFKLALVGKHARKDVLLRFALPAIVAAMVGAYALTFVSGLHPLTSYQVSGKEFFISPVKLLLGLLIVGFTLFELIPKLRDLEIDAMYLPLGGIVSGFFGGLSGHQGALRSAFLARAGLTKEQFVGTGTVISVLIDVSRLIVYSKTFPSQEISENLPLLALTTVAAFTGAYLGNRLLKKITMSGVQKVVSFTLLGLALALGSGLI